MVQEAEIASKISDFISKNKEKLDAVRDEIEDFNRRFPFRPKPTLIDGLKPSDVYEKGARESFFYWVEFGTFDVAHLSIYGATNYENTKGKLNEFKELLKLAVDDKLSVHEKVDAPWDSFRGFGGDRHIAKKILSLFYPEAIFPIMNTGHLQHFAAKLGLDVQVETKELFNREYEDTSVGERFEAFNNILNRWRQKHASVADNVALARFLYATFSPPEKPSPSTRGERAGALGLIGHLFEPENELGVVSLFSMHHRELGFPFIISIQASFPDAIVIDSDKKTLRVEFEYMASNFIQHNHPEKGCDLIVCWENDLKQNIAPEVLALEDEIPRLVRTRFLSENEEA